MRRDYLLKVFLTLWAIWGMAVSGFAQQITVNGVVQDTQGEPIIGANILIKGTATGTITDLDGNFQLMTDADAKGGDLCFLKSLEHLYNLGVLGGVAGAV